MFLSFLFIAPEDEQLFNKTFSADNIDHFVISNLAGHVKVLSGNSTEIKVVAHLDDKKMNDDLSIEYKQEEDYLVVYIKTPCTKEKEDIVFDPDNPSETVSWRNKCSNQCNFDGDLTEISFEVHVPNDMNVYASTILDGDVKVHDVNSNVWVQNVNGSIELDNVQQVSHATTVNGDITLTYSDKPKKEGTFSTINGDIRVKTRGNIDAHATFKSFSGDFYTDMEPLDMLPSEVVEQSKEKGFKYRIDDMRRIKIGNGGVLLAFQTFNGDAYLVKN